MGLTILPNTGQKKNRHHGAQTLGGLTNNGVSIA